MSPNVKILQNKISYNTQKKDNFKKVNILKKNSNQNLKEKIQNKSNNNHKDINNHKYQYININNNLNNIIYIQNRTSPNKQFQVQNNHRIYKIEQKDKNTDIRNHSYREISSINRNKKILAPKTIYHAYINLEKKIISNNSPKNIGKKIKKNNTVNNIKKPTYTNNYKKIITEKNKYNNNNNIYINKCNKIKLNFANKDHMENNYKIFDDIKNENNDYKYNSRNGKNIEEKIRYYNMNTPSEYNKNVASSCLNNNIVSSRNQIYYSFATNNIENNNYLYQEMDYY